MQVFIQTPTKNNSFVVRCESSDLVSQLKSKIEAGEGFSFSQQTLSFHCKPLKDNIRLGEYGITENSTVFLNLRLIAGSEKILPARSTELKPKKKKTNKQGKQINNLDDFIKRKENFLPEGYAGIAELQDMYLAKKRRKEENCKWEKLLTHGDTIKSVVISANNKYVISGSEDNSIKVFDLETRQEYHHFKDIYKSWVRCIAVSPDSKFIVSGGIDKSIKIFDLETKQELHHFVDAHEHEVTALAVCNNNNFLVSGSKDKSIKIFDLKTKEVYHHFSKTHQHWVTSVAVTTDDKYIVSASYDKSIKVFDIQAKQEYHWFQEAHKNSIASLALSNNNKFIVTGAADNSIKIFDLENKKEHYCFENAHEDNITSVAITSDDRFIVAGSADSSIKIFDLHNKQEHFQLKENFGLITSLAVSRDNMYIATGFKDKSVRILELKAKEEKYGFVKAHEGAIISVAISNQNKFIVSAGIDKSVKIFDIQTKQEYHCFEAAHKDTITSVVVSNDNKFIVSGSLDKSIKIFDIQNKEEHHHFVNAHRYEVLSVALSKDCRFIVSGSADRSVNIFDFKTKEEYHHFTGGKFTKYLILTLSQDFRSSVYSVAISNDNRFVAAGLEDGSVNVYNIDTKQNHHYFPETHKKAPVRSVAIFTNKTGTFVVSGSEDKSLKIFDVDAKQERYHFKEAHKNSVMSVAVSQDSRFIISGSCDNSIKIFDIETKQEHYHYRDVDKSFVFSVAISEDGRFLVSASAEGLIKIFEIPSTKNAEIFYVSEKIPSNCIIPTFDEFILTDTLSLSFDQLILFYQDLYVSTHYWTLLHLICLFQNPKIISLIPSYADFKIPFLLDRYSKTPLHYLLAHDHMHYPSIDIVFNYMLDYIEDKDQRTPYELELIFKSLTSLVPFILSKTNSKTRDRYLKLTFMPSTSFEYIPIFGSAQPRNTFSQTSILHPNIKDKIYKNGIEQVMFRSMMLYYDYRPGLTDMHNIVWVLLYLRNEEIFKSMLVGHLINYLWNATNHIMIMSAVPFWIYMILLSVYFGIGTRMLAMEIIIVLLAVFLLLGELVQISTLRKRYIQNLWNWFDMSQILLTIAFFIMRFSVNEEDENILASQWISSFIIMIGYVRWVTYLRLFKATRNLIQVIISIVQDMIGFIVILVFIIVGFSLIFLQFNRDNEYPIHLFDTYQVLYGSYDTTDAGLSQKLLAALILFLLNVVLLNLLISIMGDSYDKIQERRLLTDSVTRLEMILEAMAYMRVFNKGKNHGKGFLIFCLPEQEEEDNAAGNEWEGRINLIRKLLKQSEQKIEEGKEISLRMGSKIENIEHNVDKKIQTLEKHIEKKMDLMEKQILSAIGKLLPNNK